jgi:hypothetical protein
MTKFFLRFRLVISFLRIKFRVLLVLCGGKLFYRSC